MAYTIYTALGADGSALYVGMTENFKRRVCSHLKKSWMPLVAKWETFEVSCKREAKNAEKSEIIRLNPPYNKLFAVPVDHLRCPAHDKLSEWSKRSGRKNKWVADQIGVHANTVGAWIIGTLRPGGDNRVKLETLTEGAVKAVDWVIE